MASKKSKPGSGGKAVAKPSSAPARRAAQVARSSKKTSKGKSKPAARKRR
jgi:hypothetical protein